MLKKYFGSLISHLGRDLDCDYSNPRWRRYKNVAKSLQILDASFAGLPQECLDDVKGSIKGHVF